MIGEGSPLLGQVGSDIPVGEQVVRAVESARSPLREVVPFLHDLGHGVVERVVSIPHGVADLVTHRHEG